MVYLAENQQIHLQKHAWISMQPKTFHRLKNLIVDTSRGAKPCINFFLFFFYHCLNLPGIRMHLLNHLPSNVCAVNEGLMSIRRENGGLKTKIGCLRDTVHTQAAPLHHQNQHPVRP